MNADAVLAECERGDFTNFAQLPSLVSAETERLMAEYGEGAKFRVNALWKRVGVVADKIDSEVDRLLDED